jgi:hypothetical protein
VPQLHRTMWAVLGLAGRWHSTGLGCAITTSGYDFRKGQGVCCGGLLGIIAKRNATATHII